MKGKIKQLKIAAITLGVIFIIMFLNIIYLNVKVIELSKSHDVILQSK